MKAVMLREEAKIGCYVSVSSSDSEVPSFDGSFLDTTKFPIAIKDALGEFKVKWIRNLAFDTNELVVVDLEESE